MKFLTKPIVLVDIETTGGSPVRDRIIEIACLRFENGVEVARFQTLIDPGRPIPLGIQHITGIGDHMLTAAPSFADCTDELEAIFEGATFGAHNARFDYSFIKAEMKRLGKKFQMKQLCTVRLSRKLFKEHARHDLSSIIKRYNIPCEARHRAMGDTEAMRDFLLYVEKNIPHEEAALASKEIMDRSYVSPEVADNIIQNLPDTPGTYSMYAEDGTLLYIGKSINIKTRVISHFTNTHNEGKELRLFEQTKTIDFTETGSDLGASLLELHQIKTLYPLYNRRSRRSRGFWYLVKHPDTTGYVRFTLEKKASLEGTDFESIYGIFKDKRQAKAMLQELMDEHHFCGQTFGLEKNGTACFSVQLSKCSGSCMGTISAEKYNLLIETVFAKRKLRQWPYTGAILVVASNTKEKRDYFIVNDWLLIEAYTESGETLTPLFPVSEHVFDYDAYRILNKAFMTKNVAIKVYKENSDMFKQFIAMKESVF